MSKKIKRLVALGMACTLLVSTNIMGATTSYFLSEDKDVMVPVREVAEGLGFQVGWDAGKQEVTLENGMTKMVFQLGIDAYQKSSGRLSRECIMMYVPKELGEAAVLKEGKTYVPANLFDYALDETDVLTIKDHVATTKEGMPLSYYKEVDVQLGDKMYSMSINLPDYIGPYVTLTTQTIHTGEMEYPLCFLKFENEEGIAQIGLFSIFTHEQYEAVKAEGGPVPTEVLQNENYVIGFTGLQDMPFELETKAAELVGNYHKGVAEILKTVVLTQK